MKPQESFTYNVVEHLIYFEIPGYQNGQRFNSV